MMPTQSWKNLDPEDGVHWTVPEEYWQIIRDHWPAYDKRITPTNSMGAVAEAFRLWPGALRSDHPARSVAAWGKHAEYLVKNHDLSNIFGEGSPIGKLYELDGKVLLIGVGYDKNTSLHLADVRADYPGKHTCIEHSAISEGGRRVWKEYERKSENRAQKEDRSLAAGMMEIFAEYGKAKHLSPSSDEAQGLARRLQDYITGHYYTCTKQILARLGQAYAAGGEFTENIDKAGGPGTAQFAAEAIRIYCAK